MCIRDSNDSEREIDWLIELEYEPLPDVDPDCNWLTETEVLTDVEVDSGAEVLLSLIHI